MLWLNFHSWLWFDFVIIYGMYVFLCECISHVSILEEDRKRSPGAGHSGSCELPDWGAGTQTSVLWKNGKHSWLDIRLPFQHPNLYSQEITELGLLSGHETRLLALQDAAWCWCFSLEKCLCLCNRISEVNRHSLCLFIVIRTWILGELGLWSEDYVLSLISFSYVNLMLYL